MASIRTGTGGATGSAPISYSSCSCRAMPSPNSTTTPSISSLRGPRRRTRLSCPSAGGAASPGMARSACRSRPGNPCALRCRPSAALRSSFKPEARALTSRKASDCCGSKGKRSTTRTSGLASNDGGPPQPSSNRRVPERDRASNSSSSGASNWSARSTITSGRFCPTGNKPLSALSVPAPSRSSWLASAPRSEPVEPASNHTSR